MDEEVWGLFQLEEREYHYVAIELLGKFKKQLTVKDLIFCLKLIEIKSWWDSVDSIAPTIVGDIVMSNRAEGEDVWSSGPSPRICGQIELLFYIS